jgi:NADH dehydrogenase [ubiquinone] 1 alpha subcomplex assembly factor 1
MQSAPPSDRPSGRPRLFPGPWPRAARLATLVAALATAAAGQEPDPVSLVDFRAGLPDDWAIVNDGVMGGVSSSTLTWEDGAAVFAGDLSLENNGGFASVRIAIPPGALAGADRLSVRVRGDGKRYQLRLRPGRRFDGVAFAASFDTRAGEWTDVSLPLAAFQPTFRGYRPRGVGPLDPARVGQLGFMLTDKQEGPFRLEIEWIARGGGE